MRGARDGGLPVDGAVLALTPRRLVALRALGLGDLLTGLPALRALADAFPEHRRTLVCGPSVVSLATLAGVADEVVGAAPLAPLPAHLQGPDVAVNLHGRGPQSHLLLARLAPGRLTAFANSEAGVAGPRWRADEHEVDRWCRLLVENDIPADRDRLHLDVAPDPAMDGVTVIHPGAASPGRRWPAGRFAAVARREADAGRRVVVTGSAQERVLAASVAAMAGLPRTAVLAGDTGLVRLAAVVAAAARIVCSDTGVAHLATAVGTPSVVVFGPTPPAHWGPPAEDPRHRALWAGITGDPHAVATHEGLLRIPVSAVVEALEALPGR